MAESADATAPRPSPSFSKMGSAGRPANLVAGIILYNVDPERSTGSRLILIVDDDLDHRAICRELLEAHGHLVEEVGDGRKALARLLDAEQTQPALILLDLSMPLMDGWQLLAIMKSYIRLNSIPVVLMTAEEPRLEPEKHGTIAGQLRKPFEAEQLRAVASRFIPSPGTTPLRATIHATTST